MVYDIYQDSQGFIWVATENGLNGFDGYMFKTFYHAPQDSTTISSNIVRSIFEDKVGNIWIGTLNGMFHIDLEKNHFSKLPPPKQDNQMVIGIEKTINS